MNTSEISPIELPSLLNLVRSSLLASACFFLLLCLAIGTYSQVKAHGPSTKTSKTGTATTKKSQAQPASSTKCTENNGMSADLITEVLEAQNKMRSELKLANLTWNCDLAATAQEWATRGIFEHRPDNIFGENIYVSANADVTPAFAVKRWLSEGDFWNNKSGTCQDGKVCSHFTQIVWRFTKQVGCGINRNASGKWKVMLVCDYDPTGSDDGPAY